MIYCESIYFTTGVGMTEADFFPDKAVSKLGGRNPCKNKKKAILGYFIQTNVIRKNKKSSAASGEDTSKGFAKWQWKHDSQFGVKALG